MRTGPGCSLAGQLPQCPGTNGVHLVDHIHLKSFRCCYHDALYDLCCSPRTMRRDPWFGQVLLQLLHQPPSPETQPGWNPWQFRAADKATKALICCYNIKQIFFQLL